MHAHMHAEACTPAHKHTHAHKHTRTHKHTKALCNDMGIMLPTYFSNLASLGLLEGATCLRHHRSEGFPRTGYFIPWRDGMGLADFRRYSGGGACAFLGFGTFWGLGRFGVVDLSGFNTEILRFRRNPTFQEKSYLSGDILRFRRHPTFQEASYVSGDILRFRRNPTSSQRLGTFWSCRSFWF